MPEETVESYAVCFNGDAVLLEKNSEEMIFP